MSMPPVPKGAERTPARHAPRPGLQLRRARAHHCVRLRADIFLDAVRQVVAANKDYIPPEGKVGN
jgi:hypothetical protein